MLSQVNLESQVITSSQTSQIVTFRHAHPLDRTEIVSNINAVSAEKKFLYGNRYTPTSEWEAALAGRRSEGLPKLLIIVEIFGQAVGHCRIFPVDMESYNNCGEVGIALLKRYRDIGIGTKLLEYTLAQAQEFGYARFVAEIFGSNTRAIRLFEKCEFRLTHQPFGQYWHNNRKEYTILMQQSVTYE